MEVGEKEQQIDALREELRNGRISQTGESAVGHGESANGSARSSVQAIGRNNGTVKGNTAAIRGDKRSVEKEPQRERPGGRRSSNNGSGATNGNIESARDTGIVAIERLDDIPERIDNELPVRPTAPVQRYKEEYVRTMRGGKFVYCLIADRSQVLPPDEYKSLPSRKDTGAAAPGAATPGPSLVDGIKKLSDTILPAGKGVLTNAECREYQEPLGAALVDYGGYLDKFLQMRYGQPDLEIWGDITELEAAVLARLLIRRGQKNAAAAEMVRTMVNGDDYIQGGIILVPRMIKTAEARQEARKQRIRGKK